MLTDFERRLAMLETQGRFLRIACGVLSVLLVGAIWMPRPAAQSNDPIRARGLIIEDASGRPRISIGAPIPGDNRTANFRTGMRINDPNGAERMGLTVDERGAMILGLDAPVDTGDNRNRERITIVADQDGGAHIRFLDRRTSVPARWYLDDQNRVWMEFSDYTQQPTVRRRIGLKGEETITGTP